MAVMAQDLPRVGSEKSQILDSELGVPTNSRSLDSKLNFSEGSESGGAPGGAHLN